MDEINPYRTPTASVEVADQAFYHPDFFSLSGRIGPNSLAVKILGLGFPALIVAAIALPAYSS